MSPRIPILLSAFGSPDPRLIPRTSPFLPPVPLPAPMRPALWPGSRLPPDCPSSMIRSSPSSGTPWRMPKFSPSVSSSGPFWRTPAFPSGNLTRKTTVTASWIKSGTPSPTAGICWPSSWWTTGPRTKSKRSWRLQPERRFSSLTARRTAHCLQTCSPRGVLMSASSAPVRRSWAPCRGR